MIGEVFYLDLAAPERVVWRVVAVSRELKAKSVQLGADMSHISPLVAP